jgi:hypothetical protein
MSSYSTSITSSDTSSSDSLISSNIKTTSSCSSNTTKKPIHHTSTSSLLTSSISTDSCSNYITSTSTDKNTSSFGYSVTSTDKAQKTKIHLPTARICQYKCLINIQNIKHILITALNIYIKLRDDCHKFANRITSYLKLFALYRVTTSVEMDTILTDRYNNILNSFIIILINHLSVTINIKKSSDVLIKPVSVGFTSIPIKYRNLCSNCSLYYPTLKAIGNMVACDLVNASTTTTSTYIISYGKLTYTLTNCTTGNVSSTSTITTFTDAQLSIIKSFDTALSLTIEHIKKCIDQIKI